MGIKGRDFLAWLILAGIAAIVMFYPDQTAKNFVLLFILTMLGLFFLHLIEVCRAKKLSKRMGLEIVILIPLIPKWAEFIVSRYLQCSVVCAYEIHIRETKKTKREMLYAMENDLAYIEKNMQGVFLWETGVTIPRRIRKIINDYKSKGLAVWEDGMLLIPRPPFVGRKHKKKFKRGVMVIE
ncbi:MAG: hypothetical protein K9L17_08320 [Clostridiales bacterium]|nr:hypothetical protein [Clostridiales bacterium]MCF8022680.1 hypothetical protein [Clostridiales bacterium]